MKNLALVSFVGIDTKTNLDDLLKFKDKNIKYEFGVLFSDSKNDLDPRYPSNKFSSQFLEWAKEHRVNRSLHLCGGTIDRYLAEHEDIMTMCANANRIQLNINMKNHGKDRDPEKLANDISRILDKYNHHIIMQKNPAKHKFNNIFMEMIKETYVKISLLNDSSCGLGKEIQFVSVPHGRYFTGYAGGINQENVIKIINTIEKWNTQSKKYYIDMESGIRTNNVFSIEKCQKIKDLIDRQ